MKLQERSWRALGLLGLALTAGAIRFGEEVQSPREFTFQSMPAIAEREAVQCGERFDPTWFGECLQPERRLVASR
jgi:hypothetical protein